MARLLRIDASARLHGSHSREIADYFQTRWLQQHPDDEVVARNLLRDPVPHIEDATISGFYTPASEHDAGLKTATALSDQLIEELMSSDLLLISTPMYNFSLPSVLKAWVDQIVRIGYTFNFDPDTGFTGLVQGKRAVVVTATGAVFSNPAMSAFNYLDPYLRTLLGFLGITDSHFVSVEGTTTDEAAMENSKRAAREAIDHYILKTA